MGSGRALYHRRSLILNRIGTVCALLLVLAGGTVIAVRYGAGLQVLSVQSDSMAPVIQKGDAVAVRSLNGESVRAGDIVSYASSQDRSVIITHRVIEVNEQTGRVVTMGDNNSVADPVTHEAYLLGRVDYVIPGLGYGINLLHNWWGLAFIVYLPAASVVLIEISRLTRHYLRPTYQLRHLP